MKTKSSTVQILGGIADTVAQSLTAIRIRSKMNRNRSKDISDGIEMTDQHEKSPYAIDILSRQRNTPPPFDFERLTRFMSFGLIMSPLQFKWFSFLSRSFPITKESAALPALKRVAFDQLIWAPLGMSSWSSFYLVLMPVGLATFFTFMTVSEGGGRRALSRKFQDVYLPSLKANYMVWPLVQILNFRVIPLPFQIVIILVSFIGTIQMLMGD